MESTIEPRPSQEMTLMLNQLVEHREDILKALPEDVEESAQRCHILRRKRGIKRAADLLYLGLGYSVLDQSLNQLGIWANEQAIADLSAPALYGRLCEAKVWIGTLLFAFLQERRLRLPQGQTVNLDIRDATVISRPGSQGTDWRIHLSLDLAHMCIDGVELTDAKGGETLVRFAGQADRIVLADRIHANRAGLTSLLKEHNAFVIRMTWQNLPLEDELGQAWQVIPWLQTAFADPTIKLAEQPVVLRTPETKYPLRVCAVRLDKEAAERAVRRARKQAIHNGHTPDERTLFAAQFVLVVTNLSSQSWPTQSVLELYRVRWQVELFFKRLKSILLLDHLRARGTELAQTYLLTKLLAACLLDTLAYQMLQRLPLGFSTGQHPLSYWTLISTLWEHLQALIRGPVSVKRLMDLAPKLQRYLYPPPRQRKQQLAATLHLLAATPVSTLFLANDGLS